MSFKFHMSGLDKDKIYVEVVVSGDLEEGPQTHSLDWLDLKDSAHKYADEKYIVFNLSGVTYWDTGGMSEVLGTIWKINTDHRRKKAGFIEPENSHLVVLARPMEFLKKKFKVEVSESQIPHRKTLADLLTYLQS